MTEIEQFTLKREDIKDLTIKILEYDTANDRIYIEASSSICGGLYGKEWWDIWGIPLQRLTEEDIMSGARDYMYGLVQKNRYRNQPGRTDHIKSLVGKEIVKEFKSWEK